MERLGIMFGTYARSNPGTAELHLSTSDGRRLIVPIDLPALSDNQYNYFKLDPAIYVSGEIVYRTGGGISTWEAHRAGEAATCLVQEHPFGRVITTPGCPRP